MFSICGSRSSAKRKSFDVEAPFVSSSSDKNFFELFLFWRTRMMLKAKLITCSKQSRYAPDQPKCRPRKCCSAAISSFTLPALQIVISCRLSRGQASRHVVFFLIFYTTPSNPSRRNPRLIACTRFHGEQRISMLAVPITRPRFPFAIIFLSQTIEPNTAK